MFSFGIKDIIDILIVALLLYTLYKMMKESGTISIFTGVLAFVGVWIVVTQILDMRLIGSIMDKFMSVGSLYSLFCFKTKSSAFSYNSGRTNDGDSFSISSLNTKIPEKSPISCPSYMPV